MIRATSHPSTSANQNVAIKNRAKNPMTAHDVCFSGERLLISNKTNAYLTDNER